ncbi:hypothetical protein EVAR_52707_1 [Eumeta japonica]|uniref:Uncharacterized protein n=1 Tax=Eumeta variegata TaxID=151549 RepID=A0A4C1Y4X2_EUMVA|nr:hypothetical protein EVAR_52707_1 [Eumeta japonica]
MYTYGAHALLTYSSDFGAARLDSCELRTVIPYTYTLSECSAELHDLGIGNEHGKKREVESRGGVKRTCHVTPLQHDSLSLENSRSPPVTKIRNTRAVTGTLPTFYLVPGGGSPELSFIWRNTIAEARYFTLYSLRVWCLTGRAAQFSRCSRDGHSMTPHLRNLNSWRCKISRLVRFLHLPPYEANPPTALAFQIKGLKPYD